MGLTPMMLQYLEIHDKVQDAIMFFRAGDFYEMFFDDAILASKELELTLTGKNCGLDEKAPMCGVPYHSAESYIAKLIEKGYKVAICEQLEDPNLVKGLVKRDVVRVVSPGTMVDNNFLDPQANNFLMSLYGDKRKNIGCAFLDLSTGDFSVTEYNGNDPLEFLMTQLSRFNPSEILIHPNFFEDTFVLDELKKRFSFFSQPVATKYFELKKAQDRLCKQFNVFSVESLGLQNKFSSQRAAGALLNYIDETQKQDIKHLNSLTINETNDVMSLDSSTIRNLELTRTIRSGEKKGSLLSILDKTKTAAGSRLLTSLLEAPLLDKDEINNRLDRTEELFSNKELSDEISKHLSNIYDLERICSKINYGTVVPADFISLKQSIDSFSKLTDLIQNSDLIKIKEDFKDQDRLVDIYDLLEQSINDDFESKPFGKTIKIKRGYNAQFDSFRAATENGKEWLDKIETNEKEATGIPNLKVKYNKVFGYFIEVPNGKKDLVPDRYIRKQTLVNAERYFTPELKKLEEKINDAQENMDKLEAKLYNEIIEKVKEQIKRIQDVAKICSKLDVFQSFSEIARINHYVRPEITDGYGIKIENGRHPVIEDFIGRNYFISNNTNFSDDEKLILITGPNMAGKSTYIRQSALIVLMAQIGSFVPADKAEIGIVDRIFTRVGASDDIATGQSTFMVEMSEVSNILKNATEKSLVILDEVGRGTSTFDGISIAWAVCEDLLKRNIKTLFATHYHELTELEATNGFVNYNIRAKETKDGVVFLRKIQKGKADQSYGVEVAKLAGFPKRVLNRANKILAKLEENNLNTPGSVQQNFNADQVSIFNYQPQPSELEERLKSIDPDNLTPREAHSLLYELKAISNEN